MKLTQSEYDELVRKKPSLRPAEVIKAQNSHSMFNEAGMIRELAQTSPWVDLIENPPKNITVTEVTAEQEKCVKSPRTLKFTIPGQPVGKPRQTQSDRWKKRPCVMRYRAWADKARASVPKGESLGIYREISFVAYLEFPKSYSMTRTHILAGQPHLLRGDGDNILKAIQDSLFKEDKMIWKFSGEKRWNDGKGSRIEVELR